MRRFVGSVGRGVVATLGVMLGIALVASSVELILEDD